MKYILFILLISMMLITACNTTNVSDEDSLLTDDTNIDETDEIQEEDDVSEDDISEDEILPELADPEDEVEIGDMI